MTPARKAPAAITPPWPEGVYDLAMIDVPLRFAAWSPKGETRSPQVHYPTMEPAELVDLLTPMFERVLAPNAAVCWWVYGLRLPESLDVLQRSGLTYRSELLVSTPERRCIGGPE